MCKLCDDDAKYGHLGAEEMTDTKPTLEEQIDYQQRLLENYQVNPVVTLIAKSILASLKELHSIRSAEMPVEPARWDWTRDGMSEQPSGQFVESVTYDALKSYALKEKDECQRQTRESFRLAKLHEKVESELAALRGRLMEPDEEMLAAATKAISQTNSIGEGIKAMTAVALKEGK